MKSIFRWGAAAAAGAVLAAGCAGKQAKKSAALSSVPAEESSSGTKPEAAATASNDREPSDRSALQQTIPQLVRVNFAYDSSLVDTQARKTLQGNARWLAGNPTAQVQVAGECDQRGTVEYNLALGERRARAVRDYYRHLGIAGNRISTISYGKEKPLCDEMNESCWKQNRRAETLETVPQAVSRATPRTEE